MSNVINNVNSVLTLAMIDAESSTVASRPDYFQVSKMPSGVMQVVGLVAEDDRIRNIVNLEVPAFSSFDELENGIYFYRNTPTYYAIVDGACYQFEFYYPMINLTSKLFRNDYLVARQEIEIYKEKFNDIGALMLAHRVSIKDVAKAFHKVMSGNYIREYSKVDKFLREFNGDFRLLSSYLRDMY